MKFERWSLLLRTQPEIVKPKRVFEQLEELRVLLRKSEAGRKLFKEDLRFVWKDSLAMLFHYFKLGVFAYKWLLAIQPGEVLGNLDPKDNKRVTSTFSLTPVTFCSFSKKKYQRLLSNLLSHPFEFVNRSLKNIEESFGSTELSPISPQKSEKIRRNVPRVFGLQPSGPMAVFSRLLGPGELEKSVHIISKSKNRPPSLESKAHRTSSCKPSPNARERNMEIMQENIRKKSQKCVFIRLNGAFYNVNNREKPKKTRAYTHERQHAATGLNLKERDFEVSQPRHEYIAMLSMPSHQRESAYNNFKVQKDLFHLEAEPDSSGSFSKLIRLLETLKTKNEKRDKDSTEAAKGFGYSYTRPGSEMIKFSKNTSSHPFLVTGSNVNKLYPVKASHQSETTQQGGFFPESNCQNRDAMLVKNPRKRAHSGCEARSMRPKNYSQAFSIEGDQNKKR